MSQNILQVIAQTNFESSSTLTPEWKSAYAKLKRYINKILKDYATNIQMSRGHFYAIGFFTANSGQIWYISINDVRATNTTILIRKVKSYRDFSGVNNQWININSNFEDNLHNMIQE